MKLFNDGFFTQDGVTLHYVEGGQPAGTAPLMLFYHGFPSFWYSFHLQMQEFAKDYHVVAVDGLGANLSDRPDDLSDYKIENLSAQIDGLTKQLIGDEKFYLVGHDWGGALSWSFAQQYPHRLHKLIVNSAPPTNQLLYMLKTNPKQLRRSSYMYAMRGGEVNLNMTRHNNKQVCDNICAGLRELDHYTQEMEQEFRRGLSTPGAVDAGINWYRANIPQADAITDSDYWPSIDAKTRVSSLLIWGDADLTFVTEFIDELPKYAENLTVFRLVDVGHSPMLEKPAEVNEAMREFLRQP